MIKPFKDRWIDTDRPVEVYRNLNNREFSFSIRQDGLVVGHTNGVCLRDVEFVVRKAGQRRVIETGRKNVHAFARGHLTESCMGTDHTKNDLPVQVKYDPYLGIGFHHTHCGRIVELKGALSCIITKSEGMRAAYTHKL